MNFSDIIESVLHNPVVTGLSFTAVLGAVAYQLRNIPRLVVSGTLRFLTVELTITSTDPAFECIDGWLAHQPYAKRAKMLTLQSHRTSEDVIMGMRSEPNADSHWSLSPGPGLHMFWWRKRPVFLERRYLSKEGDDGRRNKPVETLRFRTIGRSQMIMRRLISDVREFTSNDTVSVKVWTDHYWNKVPGKTRRSLDSIILRDGQIERVMEDVTWFQNSRSWYNERGIPYRRGYLFSGCPGTGKTSMVLALAGHFNRPICVLGLSGVADDNALFAAFCEAPPNAIILLEDVDCAYPAQTRTEDAKETGKVTKAGLLNAIDGITTPDGRIFIMTTNYPERLDHALIRPGRADVHERFDMLGPTDQCRMAARFYAEPFTPVLYEVSPATLQAVFMLHPTDPRAAHEALADSE